MGRQIALIASETDEQAFLTYLRQTSSIQLFRSSAASEAELWVDSFPPYNPLETQYFIWNTAYTWRPHIIEGEAGVCHIDLPTHGPVIEFQRTNMGAFLKSGPSDTWNAKGRIYWAQYNRQKGFLKWYEAIVRWMPHERYEPLTLFFTGMVLPTGCPSPMGRKAKHSHQWRQKTIEGTTWPQ